MNPIFEAATAYVARHWNPVPCAYQGKKPLHPNWEAREIRSQRDVAAFFDVSHPQNIGLRLGKTSAGLTDIDLDWETARLLAVDFLPVTVTFGRYSAAESHWLYTTDLADDAGLPGTVRFSDPAEPDKKANTILEIRVGGERAVQTVVPPSVHTSGEAIQWSNGGLHDPTRVSGIDLMKAAQRLASACLIAKYWARGSGMHNDALLLGGVLGRAGFSVGEIRHFVAAVCRVASDPDVSDRVRTAESAAGATRQKGLPSFKKRFGDDVANVLIQWLGLHPGGAPASTPTAALNGRPKILVGGTDLGTAAGEVEDAIVALGVEVYQFGNHVTHPKTVRDRHGRVSTMLLPTDRNLMRIFMGQAAVFERYDARHGVVIEIAPPGGLADLLLSRAASDQSRLNNVRGLISCPTLRPDGSLLARQGYDQETGFLLHGRPVALPDIEEEPSKEEAEEALELLKGVLSEFVFDGKVSLAGAIAGMITPCIRPMLDRVPLLAVTAPVMGTGKSYLCEIYSMLSTGDLGSSITATGGTEEFEKRLTGLLLAGVPIILIDNASENAVGGDLLANVLTQPHRTLRPLGTSKPEKVAIYNTVYANGNNLNLSGDIIRRAVVIRLDTRVEKPWTRDFQHDPIKLIEDNHGALLAACFTIVRAYVAAGLPGKKKPLAGFQLWSDLVRSALCWLGMEDCCKGMDDAIEGDTKRMEHTRLASAWYAHFGDDVVTANGVIDVANMEISGGPANPDLFEAVSDVARAFKGKGLDAKRLGHWLNRWRGTLVAGFRFELESRTAGLNRWRVTKT